MGFFGGKKGEEKHPAEDGDFSDSPVENVSLAPKPAAAAAPAAKEPAEMPRSDYGIDNAIALMRALPVDQNVELVVQVIKTTLESLKLRVADIIEDASRKQRALEGRVAALKQQIAEYEKEIETRVNEIAKLEADHSETSSVKARLELAEKAQKAAATKSAAAALTPPAAKSAT
jgi:hypothetical protein